jgi:glucose/arabinose dehydrogenase
VPEELLDRPQVGAALQQVCREGVPEPMRMRKEPTQSACVEASPAGRDEERVLGADRQRRPDLKPAREPIGGLLAERNDSLLAAFPEDPDRLAVEVDVREVEIDCLAAAEAGRVDQLRHRAVPNREWAVGAELAELRIDLARLRRNRQPPRPPRREAGVRHPRSAEREAEKGPDGGQLAGDRRGRESPRLAARPRRAELGGVGAEGSDVDLVEGRASRLEPRGELLNVDAVRAARRLGQRRARQIPLDCGGGIHPSPFAAVKAASCLAACALATGLAAASGATQPIKVPAGYRVEVYATGLNRPTAMAFGPGGALYLTQETGEVVRIRRGSRRPQVVLRGFRVPLGLTWHRGRLFVSAQGALWRVNAGQRKAIVRNLPFGRHQQDNVVVHRGRLYFGSGSTCDVCTERSRLSAAVLSVLPDGRDLRVVARGLRNPYGLAVDPASKRLYASVNERDELGSSEPAETIVEIRQGRDFGWPRCWPSSRLKRLRGTCGGVTPPVAYLQPHSAPGGMAFWNGGLFVAEWGEYLKRVHGRKLTRVVLRRGRPALVTTFATGFVHPLAVVVDAENGLLVADHGRGVIYRIEKR